MARARTVFDRVIRVGDSTRDVVMTGEILSNVREETREDLFIDRMVVFGARNDLAVPVRRVFVRPRDCDNSETI